jgi:hypothetical protein
MNITHEEVLSLVDKIEKYTDMECIVAGGYPLSLVSGVTGGNTDVDIFIRRTASVPYTKKRVGLAAKEWHQEHRPDANIWVSLPSQALLPKGGYVVQQSDREVFKVVGLEVDVILVKPVTEGHFVEYLFNTFDVNINKVGLGYGGMFVIDPLALKDVGSKTLTCNPDAEVPTVQRMVRLLHKFSEYEYDVPESWLHNWAQALAVLTPVPMPAPPVPSPASLAASMQGGHFSHPTPSQVQWFVADDTPDASPPEEEGPIF